MSEQGSMTRKQLIERLMGEGTNPNEITAPEVTDDSFVNVYVKDANGPGYDAHGIVSVEESDGDLYLKLTPKPLGA